MKERVDDVKEFPSSTAGPQPAELVEFALSKKVEGNGFFKEKEYCLALESYSKAIEVCPNNQENGDNLVSSTIIQYHHIIYLNFS